MIGYFADLIRIWWIVEDQSPGLVARNRGRGDSAISGRSGALSGGKHRGHGHSKQQ